MKWFDKYGLLVLALVLGALLRVAGWETDDEKRRFVLFEADEIQHVDIAFFRYQQLSGDSLDHTFTPIFNVRGYGILAGTLAYAWSGISGQPPTVGRMIRLNRQLSTVFALLLISLVYLLGRGFGLSYLEAGVGALLLAFCDLNCSYSHYGIPAIGYVFGVYMTLLGIQYWEGNKNPVTSFLMMALGPAISFGFKFDFLPLAVVGGYLLYQVLRTRGSNRIRQCYAMGFGLVAFLFWVALITGFSWSAESMWDSWQTLRRENQNIIAVDQHWLENPLVYFAAVLGGIGIFATSLAIVGLKHLWRKKWPVALVVMLILLGLEFLLRWSIDTPFVRRANVFMPAVALSAAYGIRRLSLEKWQLALVVGYTLLLALMGQSNHWFDTRSRARDWLLDNVSTENTIAATPYSSVVGSPAMKDYRPEQDWDYLLLHEAYTARYWRSLTTPFGTPDCCEEVYHCRSETMCRSIQQILANEVASVEKIAHFKTYRFLPERWLFHRLFGPYESFLGDAVIYKKVD